MKTKFIPVAALMISGCLILACSTKNDRTNNDMDHGSSDTAKSNSMNTHDMTTDNPMMASMDQMKNMEMTGDVDKDFASMMILHHQSAIEMSEEEIANGKDNNARALAQKMKAMQKAEIAELQKFMGTNEPTNAKRDYNDSKELSRSVENMMNKMNALEMTGNTDKDFVMMMIPHHEGALAMAEHQVKFGKNAKLKQMAQKMITDQQKEIAELKTWQASN